MSVPFADPVITLPCHCGFISGPPLHEKLPMDTGGAHRDCPARGSGLHSPARDPCITSSQLMCVLVQTDRTVLKVPKRRWGKGQSFLKPGGCGSCCQEGAWVLLGRGQKRAVHSIGHLHLASLESFLLRAHFVLATKTCTSYMVETAVRTHSGPRGHGITPCLAGGLLKSLKAQPAVLPVARQSACFCCTWGPQTASNTHSSISLSAVDILLSNCGLVGGVSPFSPSCCETTDVEARCSGAQSSPR